MIYVAFERHKLIYHRGRFVGAEAVGFLHLLVWWLGAEKEEENLPTQADQEVFSSGNQGF